ncbi:hypothetical protein [uncultured Catenibacterium sp.]|uniref:hypothetical protein n=1 Tax=uncultured Catenibacterium sp. TaxID=286142 RepID=UPI0025CD3457|nr:hypothetical protein [uncultured Catenibacterium sp.]
MVKRILTVLVLVSVILIPGCTKDKYSGEFKNDEEVADYVETIINKKYSRYFDNEKLYCSDYGTTDEEVFYATVYVNDEKYEFGVEYDIKNKTLETDASKGYHYETLLEDIRNTIPNTMRCDVQSVKCNKRKGFIKDYQKFISDKDTKIELMLYFDDSMSDDDAKQVQELMKTLYDKEFNGTVQCCNGEYYSEVFKLGSIPNIKDIEKCDNE